MGYDKENKLTYELLFEDVTSLILVVLKNDQIVSKGVFYKPGYFDGSRCYLTKDYIICSARMEVGVSRLSRDLAKKNYLFVWKK